MKRNDIIMLATLTAMITGITYFFQNKRARLIRIAMDEVGKARTDVYWTDVLGSNPHKEWCGAFILWALHQIGLAKDWKWEIGKGFLYKLPVTLIPKPGDIAYFTKNQHQALIRKIDGDTIYLINGNGWNGVVSLSSTNKSNVTAFYSIERLL